MKRNKLPFIFKILAIVGMAFLIIASSAIAPNLPERESRSSDRNQNDHNYTYTYDEENGSKEDDTKDNNETYYIYYDLNGGNNNSNNPTSYNSGDSIVLQSPTKTGYTFKGWTGSNGTTPNKTVTISNTTGDKEYKANWEAINYTITYNLDGGTNSGSNKSTFTIESNITLQSPTKTGYTFKGWTGSNGTTPNKTVTISNTTGDKEYKANWEANKYIINLNLNGGVYSGSTTINVIYNEEYSLPISGVSKTDKVFMGWYNGTEKWEANGTYSLTDDIWLAAKYEDLYTYNISLDFNGGTSSSPTSFSITNAQIYDGGYTLPIPTKTNYSLYSYNLNGGIFTSSDGKITSTKGLSTSSTNTLIAKYEGINDSYVGDYIEFGKYPQTLVTDSSIISSLSTASDVDDDGYIEYSDNEYLKKGNDYFLVEPILWEIESDGTLVSVYIIDCVKFYNNTSNRSIKGNTIYANNYEYSEIRAFLNGYDGSSYGVNDYSNKGFYDIAFSAEEKNRIVTTKVDNSLSSTGASSNPYICEDTNDKIFLLSYEEARTYFTSYTARCAKTTDYAKACGAYTSIDTSYLGNGYFWLRSPYSNDDYSASNVRNDGYIHYNYVNDAYYGVRAACNINLINTP